MAEPLVTVGMTLAEAERRLIVATLEAHPDKPEAAEILGISLKTLYNCLKDYRETARTHAIVERVIYRNRLKILERS